MVLHKDASVFDFAAYGRVRRILFKLRNRSRYYELKEESKRLRFIEGFNQYSPPLARVPEYGDRLPAFKHSGNAGDIIYALPTVRALGGSKGAHLSLALNVPMGDPNQKHPLGGVLLNDKMYAMLAPLFIRQEYIKKISIHQNETIDYDLDGFRDLPLRNDRFGICRWYFHMFGVAVDLSKPWLQVTPDESFKDCLIVARSERYRNLTLDHRFLRQYKNVVFVGIEAEYADFRRQVPNAEWIQVSDFHQMAAIIAGGRLFIGNQSLPFSIAEGLKVPRVLEADPGIPNVVPHGENAYDVLFQSEFEFVVGKLMASNS